MNYLNFYRANQTEKQVIYTDVSNQIDLPPYTIEKDWWIVQTLRLIFSTSCSQALIFKGGTSLSKAWNLIERFSEDIDLAISREFLGFDSGMISKTQVRKLRSISYKYLSEIFVDDLKKVFKDAELNEVRFDFELQGDGDQDPISIFLIYPTEITYPDYIRPEIKIEIGSRSLREPFTQRPIRSFISELYPNSSYADDDFSIPCVNPERTLLEKLILLHEEFQKPQDKIRVNRLSRHLYDIDRIFNSEYGIKSQNPQLISDIIEHRRVFNGMKGVDYDRHYPPFLNSIPPDEILKEWEADYKTMQQEMIYGESLPFAELLEVIQQALNQYNLLNIIRPNGQ